MTPRVPEPYRASLARGGWVIAQAESMPFAWEAVSSAGSLFAYAATHPDREALPGGRGPLYQIPTPHGRWVVRRCRRGGWARVLGDRYLRIGRPRPLAELEVSLQVRARGVPTPEVVAAALYPRGIFYRAEIATAYVPEACNLVTFLYGPERAEGEDRWVAWAAAGRLLRWLYSLGVVHADLNLGNILLECCGRPPRPYLLDLDRCRAVERVSPRQRRRMLKRFRRSAEKWSRKTGRPITKEEWQAFRRAYRTVRV